MRLQQCQERLAIKLNAVARTCNLVIHHPRHFYAVPTVIRHLKVSHQNAIGYGVLSETGADFLHHVLQPFSAVDLGCVHEHGQLIRLVLWDKVNGADGDGSDFATPAVAFLKQPECRCAYLRRELSLER